MVLCTVTSFILEYKAVCKSVEWRAIDSSFRFSKQLPFVACETGNQKLFSFNCMLAYLMAKNRTVPVLPFKRIGRKLMKTTQVVEETYLLSLKLSCVFRCAVALIHVSAEL